MLLLMVTPNFGFHEKSKHAKMLVALQKVILQFCLGFLLTAVSITFGVGMKTAGRQGIELEKVYYHPHNDSARAPGTIHD